MKGMFNRFMKDYERWNEWWLEKGENCESILGAFLLGVIQGTLELDALFTLYLIVALPVLGIRSKLKNKK